MNEVRIMLVDDNAEMRMHMREYLSRQEGLRVTAECGNGLEALQALGKTPVDVIILDVIMPQMDGYSFLEEMNRQPPEHMPQVIVVSALGRDDFIMRAVELGARFYMIKPVDMAVLTSRIREVSGQTPENKPAASRVSLPGRAPTIDEKLASLFLTIGIPAHIKGYQYLRTAILLTIRDNEIINSVTKILYPSVAKKYQTTTSRVERAIRHAIEVAWSRGRIDTLNKAFGCRVATKEDKPTNGEFIAMIADKLALEQRSA